MNRFPSIIKLLIILAMISGCLPAAGCSHEYGFDRNLREITRPYLFSIAEWEFRAFSEKISGSNDDSLGSLEVTDTEVLQYFVLTERIKDLGLIIAAVRDGTLSGDLPALEDELDDLIRWQTSLTTDVERVIEGQIREALSQQGIFNPLGRNRNPDLIFPPVDFELERPPYLLVVSPRDRIDSIREITLLSDLMVSERESIEADVDGLGVSSLVTEIGGMATYPSFVSNRGGLRFVIDAAVEEWLHQYLAFKPLGFLYLLDVTGIRRDYEIATINEALAGMVSREISDLIYAEHYADSVVDSAVAVTRTPTLDFNRVMRETRLNVDAYLSEGRIEEAEAYMEQQRQYLAANGYYIRKLNQAYFAFYGTYADSPTSVSPIGEELRELRSRSATLQEFLQTAAGITSRQKLAEIIE